MDDGGRKGNERENEGCSIHQKHQIQVKQHCWIENSKMKERSEGRMDGGESEKKGKEAFEICETGENTNPQITQSSVIKSPGNGKG